MRKYDIGAIMSAYYNIPAKGKEDAREWAYKSFPKETEITLTDGTPIKIYFHVDDVHTVEARGIMDEDINHLNKDLIRRINNAYDIRRDDFNNIVFLLIQRDYAEFESIANREPNDSEDDIICYCNHIAGNKELEIILNYCKM